MVGKISEKRPAKYLLNEERNDLVGKISEKRPAKYLLNEERIVLVGKMRASWLWQRTAVAENDQNRE